VLLVVASLTYFLAWRPSDKEYEVAKSKLDLMSSAQTQYKTQLVKIVKPSDINQIVTSELKKSADDFSTALDALSSSITASRDLKTKATFDQYKESLISYSKTIKNLATSLNRSYTLLITCNNLFGEIGNIDNVDSFDPLADNCVIAVRIARSAPNTILNKQFLDEFTLLTEELMGEYRQLVDEAESSAQTLSLDDVLATQNKIAAQSNQKLNLQITPDPSEAIQKLSNTVETQKRVLLR